MDPKSLLRRLDGRSRLLVHALLSGPNNAQTVYNKQRKSDPDFSLAPFLETLCQQEARVHEDALVSKPLVCLFSEVFKRNLLCFLHLIHTKLPKQSILHLLQCLSQDHSENQWSYVLINQLYRDIEGTRKESLLTPTCTEKLKDLCERFRDDNMKGRWASCLQGIEKEQADDQAVLSQKKRKSDNIDLDVEDEEDVHQSKRVRIDFCTAKEEEKLTEEQEESQMSTSHCVDHGAAPKPQTCLLGSTKVLSDHIKAAVPVIKELLDTESGWDKSSVSALKVLHECDPDEVEVLCSMLNLSEAPEQSLPQFCSCLLELSPDLSHSTASAVITNLLLKKILSLEEPASRCLVTGVMSLCTRYPRPTCQALIEPVLRKEQTGSCQAELLCKLVEDCLEPHHRLHVFRTILEVSPWDEGVLLVIHALLDSKLELNEEDFSLFTDQLCSQSPHFSKSMKFAKIMLSVLTKYQSYVNAACHRTLSSCLPLNETFLKKSLLAALKRISL